MFSAGAVRREVGRQLRLSFTNLQFAASELYFYVAQKFGTT